MEVDAINLAGARAGDMVVVGFETASLIKASFLLYIFPIIGMIAAAAMGVGIAGRVGIDESVGSALAGFGGLAAAFFFVRKKGNRLAERSSYRPKVIRILKTPVEPPAPCEQDKPGP